MASTPPAANAQQRQANHEGLRNTIEDRAYRDRPAAPFVLCLRWLRDAVAAAEAHRSSNGAMG
jgi:hypothetical protein